MLYLKQYVKYRKEKDYLLICDCSIVQNYELPIKTFELFEELKNGYDINKPVGIENEEEIIDDLNSLNLLSDTQNSNEGFNNAKWINLGYDESEFFKM